MPTSDTRQATTKDQKLAQHAKRLLTSRYFVGTQDGALLVEKQYLFLVLAGLKPVTEASSGHWEATDGGRHTVYDDPAAVGMFLQSLGLHSRLGHDKHATTALVSLQPELLDAYKQAETDNNVAVIGELFGYPRTASAAFASYTKTGDESLLLPWERQASIEQEAGLDDTYFVNFRFSRDHWQEELAVCQRWYETLRTYSLA